MAETAASVPANGKSSSAPASSSEVYAVFGANLRSGLWQWRSIAVVVVDERVAGEISTQKARSSSTFYFQYGHRSIADLPTLRWQSSGFRFWRRSRSPTSSAGTARSVRRGIRIFERADIARRILGLTRRRANSIGELWTACSQITSHCPKRCTVIWPRSHPSPRT
jgi:hypothetical protein